MTRRVLGALPLLAAALVYANSLANGFALDDVPIIRDNPRVHDLGDLRSIWLTPYWPYEMIELGLWRPLAIFGFAVQWAIGGGDPLVFHIVSVLLHVVCTALVFLLIRRLATDGAAAVGALLFAVHPVHVEAVANVVGQSELIAAAAVLGACLVHATRPAGLHVAWPRRIAMAGLFAIGVLSKEHAIVLPGLVVAVDFAQRRVPHDAGGLLTYARALAGLLLPLVPLAAAYLLVRWHVLDGTLLGVEAGPQLHFLREEHRLLNAFRALPEVVRLLVFPRDLVADYAPATIMPVAGWTVMAALGALLLAAAVLLALALPWQPETGLPAAWFLLSFMSVSNLLFPVGVLLAERTLYLPSVAISFIAAGAWLAVTRRPPPWPRLALHALAVLVLLAGARTWLRNPDWRDTTAVQYALMRDHPESYKAQWTYAVWQAQRGNLDLAREHFEVAHRLYPRDSQLMAEYGTVLFELGETTDALQLLETAHRIHPRSTGFAIRLANAYLHLGQYADALRVATHLDALAPVAAEQIRTAASAPAGPAARPAVRHR